MADIRDTNDDSTMAAPYVDKAIFSSIRDQVSPEARKAAGNSLAKARADMIDWILSGQEFIVNLRGSNPEISWVVDCTPPPKLGVAFPKRLINRSVSFSRYIDGDKTLQESVFNDLLPNATRLSGNDEYGHYKLETWK